MTEVDNAEKTDEPQTRSYDSGSSRLSTEHKIVTNRLKPIPWRI